jgi:pimeloyl-ACP methyl ester carboxylesterase
LNSKTRQWSGFDHDALLYLLWVCRRLPAGCWWGRWVEVVVRVAGTVRWAGLATGVRVPYGEHGDADGVPVVFLHPYADSHRFFELALPYLPAGIHAYLPTQRGHGDADKPPSGYSLDELSGDVAAFLDAVGVGQAVVVGHSSGGYVAQRFALDHPDRVLGLVLVGAPRSLHGRRAPFADAVEAMEDPVDPDLVRHVFGTIPLIRPVPAAFVEAMITESAKVPAGVWRTALAELTAAVPPTDTATITVSTLILWGEPDEVLRNEQEALAAAIPGSRLIGYPDTGHLIVWERPRQVAADIAAFTTQFAYRQWTR